MRTLLNKLIMPMPDIRTLASAEAKMIMALRLAIIAQKAGMDCRVQLADRLGGKLPATRMLLALETMGHAWPDAFRIGRPCCPHATPDEYLFLQMTRCATAGDRCGFDSLICEMIGECERHRIYLDLENLVAVCGM